MTAFREASTLILIARNDIVNQPPEVLVIRRGSEATHLPDAYVFPGGNFDPVDEHVDWLSIIPFHEQEIHLNVEGSTNAQIPKAISSRLTAIRETFEECGILLCRRYCDIRNSKITPLNVNSVGNWRQKICRNPYEFLNLCRTYHCYPDVKSLFLIDVWRSPVTLPRRYNCMFFVACLDFKVEGEIDNVEVQSMEWKPAAYYIENHNLFLPPPQLYELCKLSKFKDIESLKKFIFERDRSKIQTLTSIFVHTSDGFIFLLPGDERYQQLFEMNKNVIGVKENTLNYRSRIMHRLEYRPTIFPASHKQVVIENYPPPDNDWVSSKL